jgi:DNA invertase Pin-like site-specific DNA recombinase
LFIRVYSRASTNEQDATRAKSTLKKFVSDNNQRIAAFYIENKSGASLDRPELIRLLDESDSGDVLLVESIDRLTRLKLADWDTLKLTIEKKGIIVVSLDLPTSHMVFNQSFSNDFMDAVLKAINRMLLDLLAASAYKDYKERERKQAEGIVKAKAAGKYKGRAVDQEKLNQVDKLSRETDFSIQDMVNTLGISRSTVIRYRKRLGI